MAEFKVSNDALNDEVELRFRMNEDGYLFFRKLQTPNQILNLRKDMLTAINEGGWLEKGTDLMDGIADISKRCTEGDSEYPEGYHRVFKL